MANWRRSVTPSEVPAEVPAKPPSPELEVEEDFGQTLILQPEVEHRLTKARAAFEEHPYGACVRIIGEIPADKRGPAVLERKKRAAEVLEELRSIQDDVKVGLKAGRYEGLRARMERYLELKPDDSRFQRLLRQLKEREEKADTAIGLTPATPPAPAPAPEVEAAAADEAAPSPEPRAAAPAAPRAARPSFKVYANELLRYLQVGAFAGCLLGALIGGFWRPEGYFVGGIVGGLLAAANEWLGEKR